MYSYRFWWTYLTASKIFNLTFILIKNIAFKLAPAFSNRFKCNLKQVVVHLSGCINLLINERSYSHFVELANSQHISQKSETNVIRFSLFRFIFNNQKRNV